MSTIHRLINPVLLAASALACLPGTALSQQAPSAVGTVTTGIPGVVASGAAIELIKEGFSGTEGPVALPDGSFAFTETQAARITRIAPDGAISTLLENTNGANGLGFGAHGELYAVQVLQPRVGIIHPPERAKTLVERYEGAGFGRPNDLVVSQLGHVYFTDSGANRTAPPAGAAPAAAKTEQPPTNKPAVYRIGNDGSVKRLANDIERPNGIQLSPDEKVLYVANTAGEYVLAYDLADDGTLGAKREFAKLAGYRQTDTGWSSGADGLAVDARGRLYVASTAGIQVFSPEGQALGIITLPKAPQNIAFAGPGKRTLYAVGRGAAYRIATLTAGYAGRAK
ncbi:MAG: SMP-30/gluconolactonase/LRE family protein [Pseudomonadota bacterium]